MSTPPPFAHLPRERTWLLPALDAVQRVEGSVSPARLESIAAHLRVPVSEVWGVATHYPELRLAPPGRRLVRVCTGVSCRVQGGLALLRECERRLGLAAGATTADGEVTLEAMDCAFACAIAPVIEVAHHLRGRVGIGDLDRWLSTSPEPRPQARAGSSPDAGPARPWSGQVVSLPPAIDAPSPTPAIVSPAATLARARHAAETAARSARLVVGLGTCGLAVGADELLEALRTEVGRRGLPWTVVAGGCSGACWAAPAVTLVRRGQPLAMAGPVTAAGAARFLDAVQAGGSLGGMEVDPGWSASQRRALLARCGIVDPEDVADALRGGAYTVLAQALENGQPERVIGEVRAAGLAGRGGAYFQTAVKWEGCRAARGEPKFVIVNGEEGEPGIFKDRHLMEGDPHLLLEGMLLAAFAVGASRGVLYVHGEAELSAARLALAVEQARGWGLLGERILGSGFSFEVEIRRGLGGFVLGEETALLESIEGRRAMPRTRPPFPVESGLWGKPTVINNVETLCAIPAIVGKGGAWFASLGRGHGTKLFGLSGHLRRPGVVEMELGCTLRTLIDEVGGGMSTGRSLRAVVVGGPSGSVVSAHKVDEPLLPRGSLSPGTGGVIALDADASVRDVVQTLLAFNMRESCGKCTPCREGTARLLALLEGPVDEARVKALAEVIQLASLCGLGQAAPYAVLSGLAEFPDEFRRVS